MESEASESFVSPVLENPASFIEPPSQRCSSGAPSSHTLMYAASGLPLGRLDLAAL